jgi:hypothetical protein
MEELRLAKMSPRLEQDDLGTSPEEHRRIEAFLESMKHELVKVLLPEVIPGATLSPSRENNWGRDAFST